ncbi:2Fe-2S iron-sulfur cluster-binding protein [Streptomyces sp. NRRL F-2799]|uniref:2Fe-2S iron-sulfur cluster-binding protein n=1 Tax=Streptomyces sp. NRRL F-2799 TaxID=1463844 RepID=UPI0004C9F21C|nr:(2Fe-2S)-binding protein [Streptomyces sp. NRRL F-2799]
MTDDQRGHEDDTSQGGGRWNPLPQGEYDDGATAFVQLPEGGIDALLAGDSPLAAPGHGYVPPRITTPPEDENAWGAPQEAHQWPAQDTVPPQRPHGDDRFTYQPEAQGHWAPEEAAAAPGHDVTGQWSVPVAGGDLPDESGEFTTSALAEQWGAAPPVLPGGAAAPWVTDTIGGTWGPQEPAAPEAVEEPAPVAEAEPDDEPAEGDESPVEAPEGASDGPSDEDATAETEAAPEAVEEPLTADGVSESVAAEDEEPPPPPQDEHPLASYVLRVNGADRPVTDAWIGESLLYVLRERLGLAGAKDGCSQGECGACNVQVDGRLVASCLVPAVTAAGSEVRTVEGLASGGRPSDVQRALARCGAVQCGFCVPGIAMTLHDLLEGNPAPTELETRQALCGNLCRCSGYRGVLDAVRDVVAEREAGIGADVEPDDGTARIPHQAGPGSGGVHPSAFEAPGAFGAPHDPQDHPHDPHHGQDGGQA